MPAATATLLVGHKQVSGGLLHPRGTTLPAWLLDPHQPTNGQPPNNNTNPHVGRVRACRECVPVLANRPPDCTTLPTLDPDNSPPYAVCLHAPQYTKLVNTATTTQQ